MDISLIKVPIDYAGGSVGTSLGPDCICSSSMILELGKIGHRVSLETCKVEGITEGIIENPKAKYLSSVVKTSCYLADTVEKQLSNHKITVVIGGDHSVFLGSIAGVASFANRHDEKVGVIYVDAHADFNIIESSPSGNIHGQPLAASCGFGHTDLTDLYFNNKKISSENVVIIGARDIDEKEKGVIKSSNLKVITSLDIERYGIYSIVRKNIDELSSRCKWIHLSFDVDAVDPIYAPGTGIRVPGGLTYREAICLMNTFNESGVVKSADFVEYNPLRDSFGMTCKLCQDMILALFGRKIL